MVGGSRSTQRKPTHACGEHEISTQKGPSWNSNQDNSCCLASVQTTTPLCSPSKKIRDRNRWPRVRTHFHFNQSACWSSWLWALYKHNQMAASGTVWDTEALGEEKRKEKYRGGFWEIKVSLSWSNTKRLHLQPLQSGTADDRQLLKTVFACELCSICGNGSVEKLNTKHDLQNQQRQTKVLPWMRNSDTAPFSLSIWIIPYGQ